MTNHASPTDGQLDVCKHTAEADFIRSVNDLINKYIKKAEHRPSQIESSQYFYSLLNELNLASQHAFGFDLTGEISNSFASKIQLVLQNQFPVETHRISFRVAATASGGESSKVVAIGPGLQDLDLKGHVKTAANALVAMADML